MAAENRNIRHLSRGSLCIRVRRPPVQERAIHEYQRARWPAILMSISPIPKPTIKVHHQCVNSAQLVDEATECATAPEHTQHGCISLTYPAHSIEGNDTFAFPTVSQKWPPPCCVSGHTSNGPAEGKTGVNMRKHVITVAGRGFCAE